MKELLAAVLLLTATASHSADYFLQAGAADGMKRVTAGAAFNPNVSIYKLTLHPEVSVSRWTGSDSRSWDVSVVPMLRYEFRKRVYAEAGIGLAYFNNGSFGGQSTNWQFADHLGLVFGRVGLRYSHFSNGGLKEPNPGVNALSVTYKLEF